jgi:hypothetical protein
LLLASRPFRADAGESAANRPPAVADRNNDAQPPALPARLAALKPKLQGKSPDQVLDIVTKELGQPTRIIGSGVRVPQWDIAGGLLTVDRRQGPTFTLDGSNLWLIDTLNLAAPNIVGGYEMTTVADPNNFGNRFWMGNLDLRQNGHYSFRLSNSFPKERAQNPSNFFFEHLSGTYVIEYPPGITATSALEKLTDNALLATLHFTADNAKDAGDKASMSLRLDINWRLIHFGPIGDKPLTFQMDKAWERYWK